jgi:hypothetical protein
MGRWDGMSSERLRLCDGCEAEYGGGIADAGDHACSVCGRHDAPHEYVPTDEVAVERVAWALVGVAGWRGGLADARRVAEVVLRVAGEAT